MFKKPKIIAWDMLPLTIAKYVEDDSYTDDAMCNLALFRMVRKYYKKDNRLDNIPVNIIHGDEYYYVEDIVKFILTSKIKHPKQIEAVISPEYKSGKMNVMLSIFSNLNLVTRRGLRDLFGYSAGNDFTSKLKPLMHVGVRNLYCLHEVCDTVDIKALKKMSYYRNLHLLGHSDITVLSLRHIESNPSLVKQVNCVLSRNILTDRVLVMRQEFEDRYHSLSSEEQTKLSGLINRIR